MSALVSARALALMGREVIQALAVSRATPTADEMLDAGNAERLFSALEEALGGPGHFDWIDGRQRAALNEEWARMANCLLLEEMGLAPTAPGLVLVLWFIFDSIRERDRLYEEALEALDDAD
jgi:hypothetical protein